MQRVAHRHSQEMHELRAEIDRLTAEMAQMRKASTTAQTILSRWLAHQYGHQEQFVVLREARDALRSAQTAGEREPHPKR